MSTCGWISVHANALVFSQERVRMRALSQMSTVEVEKADGASVSITLLELNKLRCAYILSFGGFHFSFLFPHIFLLSHLLAACAKART